MNHKPWFRVWQDHLFSDPRFLNLTLEAKGLLLVCWGLTNREDGKQCRLDVAALSRWCNHFCNDARDATQSLASSPDYDPCFAAVAKELVENGWIEFVDDGKAFISIGWDKWQDKAYRAYMRNQQRNRVAELSPKRRSNVAPKRERKEEEGEGDIRPPISPQKVTRESFNRFWEQYPKKIGKGAAEKAWMKVSPELELRIIAAITAQKKSEQWKDPQYIPHPATWLNQRRWEDEVQTTANGNDAQFAQKVIDDLRKGGMIYDGN